ncbi:MAG: GNAT family N-acetyltransferase [Clostridia bacterium]|nr:GNAT family N-acetyltransferase [Clostridia bacterium]
MERFYFEKPSAERKNEIIDFLSEFRNAGSEVHGSGGLNKVFSGLSFEEALERCLRMENKEYAESISHCPGKTFLMFRESDGRLVGTINVRWDLNEEMLAYAGHIGYGIRPSERRKGYNKINLYFALGEARKQGLGEVIVGCSAKNVGSERTILALGGVLEHDGIDPHNGEITRVYSIDTAASLEKYRDAYGRSIIGANG